ncbi:VWA-like domain-containing protein [uncultured Roseobacter sp.]|uniref:vWA domain-containing protein n=1 Tax=uncultured Roseobacter sp. TaxID=114847 RepID=UPI0026266370|nr:VWA-like domain-containing protein [uncultured Roseobacter sp.]
MAQRSLRAGQAIAHLAGADPALALLALWCDITDAPDGTSVTTTTGHRIAIGEDFSTLALREQIGLAGHHILHAALRHSARAADMARRAGDSFDPELFALAADAVTNEILLEAGHAIPRPAVTLRGLLTRVAGHDIADDAPLIADWDTDRLYTLLSAQDAQGRARRRNYTEDHRFQADLVPSAGAGETEQTPDAWQGHLIRAVGTARGAGRGIGPIVARIAEFAEDRTPWEVILRGLVARAIAPGQTASWRRPARRWIAAEALARAAGGPAPLFQPGYVRDMHRPRIAVGLDSSGSVSDALLGRFCAELSGITRRSAAEIHLLAFDQDVYDHIRPGPGSPVVPAAGLVLRRGGGTSFVDVLLKAEALDPSAIVILTDLDGPMGARPGVPVIWAVPGVPASPPAFGDVVTLTG